MNAPLSPTAAPAGSAPAAARARSLADVPALAAQAIALLRSPHALFAFTPDEARAVVSYMHVATFPRGATLLRENDGRDTAEVLLLLEGEVAVEAGVDSAAGAVPIASLGPGSLLGEVALLDGRPRSAQCTALSPVRAAALSRKALETMLEAHPRVAAKLMIELSHRIAERLRAMGLQLQVYAQLTASLQTEVDRLRQPLRR
ncbi:MAG: cyclic nucleotide-binding domain-containing protein [Rubrivivax sp.]